MFISWESEAFLALREYGADKFEIVIPSLSILAEPPGTVVDKVADKQCAPNGWIGQCELTSVFQPVFNTGEGKTIGHAAYVHSKSNEKIALWPWQVFAMASKDDQLIELDRLCRATHALNYYSNHFSQSDNLFVEIHPHLLESVRDDHGRAFENFLESDRRENFACLHRNSGHHQPQLETAAACIGNYRSRGYRIAANYTGPRSDWMVELDSLYPDVVRISASNLLHHEARDLDEHRAQLQRQRAGAGIWFAEQRREIHNTSASPPAAAAPVSAAAPQSAAISG